MPDLAERSRERVEDWLSDLRGRYGDFDRVEKRWTLDPEGYEVTRGRVERGANGGAGVWIAREDGAVLLAREDDREGWGDPGGKRETGESFEEAARREVREETNVECRIRDVLEAHVLELTHEKDAEEPALSSLIVIFAGEYVSGEPRPREGEIADVQWFEEPPAEVLYPEVAERPIPFDPRS